jgi:predicted Zn-dependent protease
MECKLINTLIEKCKKRDFDFAESTVQIGNYYKSELNFENIADERVQSNFLLLRIINDDRIASANFAVDEAECLDSIIEVTLDNGSPIDKGSRDLLTRYSQNSIKNVKSKFNDLRNIKSGKINDWLMSESQLISKESGLIVGYMSYVIEEQEVFYKNSLGNFSRYATTRSDLNCTLITLSNGRITNPVPVYLPNIEPFTQLSAKICTPALKNVILNSSDLEFSNLKGKTYFSKEVVSSIINGLAASFNIELVTSGTSFIKTADIKKEIFDQSVTLYDDPLEFDKGRVYFPFDIEGTQAMKKCLIKKGIVNDLLSNKERAILFPGISPGNCLRELNDINLKITPSNLVLQLDKPKNNGKNFENYINDIGFQSFFDAGPGRLKGTARGSKPDGKKSKPVLFSLDFSIKDFFENCMTMDSYGWVNGNYVPGLITEI